MLKKLAPNAKLAWTAILIFLAVFGLTVPFCGLYLDDFGLVLELQNATGKQLWWYFQHYVPGRFLHIPLLLAILKLSGGSIAGIHLISLAVDAANVGAAFLLAYSLTGLASLALPAALIFALMTNHGETHFWAYHIPATLMSTTMVLTAFILALRRRGSLTGRLIPALAVYTAAFFTYDQVCVLWPLLIAAAYFHEARPGDRKLPAAAAAAYFVCLNLIHLALRYFSAHAAGGRPLVHPGQVPRRIYDALRSAMTGTFQQPSWGALPHWSLIALLVLAALALGIFAARRIAAAAAVEKTERSGFFSAREWRRTAAFGAAWFFLAYVPNFFNFLSPRHGYLPSFGWALLWTVLLSAAYRRWEKARRPILVLGVLLFANAVVGNVHEGSEWMLSAAHHRRYLREAGRLSSPLDNIFLVGAPRSFRRAPGFKLMHDVRLSVKNLLHEPTELGDNHLLPTDRGGFFQADLSSWPRDFFFWLPLDRINLVSYRPAEGYRCARALRLLPPEGEASRRPLRPSDGCADEPSLRQEVALSAVEKLPPHGGAPLAELPGLKLVGAEFSARPGLLRAVLEWEGEAPARGFFAYLPSLRSPAGELVYEPVYRSEALRSDVIWPWANDRPAAAGRIRETFVARTRRDIAPGTYAAKLDVYRIEAGIRAQSLGSVEFKAEIR
ncbi:MAG: hypothetical protein ABIJ96_06730 [Elusimicrobiota bacterium]